MKRTALLIAVLLLAHGMRLQSQHPAIQPMLAAVSADSLVRYDAALVQASGYYSRVAFTPGNDSSVGYIYRMLKRYPAITRVELDTFFVDDSVSRAAGYAKKPLFNVFGIIPGKANSKTAVVIGAHLDSYAGRESTWIDHWKTIRAPGADDNGSGVSTVLEAARIFGSGASFGFTNDRPIIFALFNAEEAGRAYQVYLYGSSHFAARLKAEGYSIAAMINIDMVGFNTNLTMDVVSDNPSIPIGQTAVAVNSQYGLGLAMNPAPFVYATYSDHSSFWNQGFPAVLLIEHAPPNQSTSNYTINSLYHTSHDTLGALNPELMKRSAQAAIGTAAMYAVNPFNSSVKRLNAQAPAAFALEQNFPNPFNPSTTLRFSIAETRFVELRVVDVLGRVVATLVHERMQPGTYAIDWNAAALPSGMYVAEFRAWNAEGRREQVFLETKKLLMQK
jgi:hypothetical protein